MPDLGWKLACIKMYIIYNLDFQKSNQFQDEDGTYVGMYIFDLLLILRKNKFSLQSAKVNIKKVIFNQHASSITTIRIQYICAFTVNGGSFRHCLQMKSLNLFYIS